MEKVWRIGALALVLAGALNGCAYVTAAPYSPNPDNAAVMIKADIGPVAVKAFTAADPSSDERLPGSLKMASPVDGSFASYLTTALREELMQAGKFGLGSTTVVTGTLLENEIGANQFSRSTGHIKARFVVTRAEQTVYDQVKSGSRTWGAAPFAGRVAVEMARYRYPNIVQDLMNKLFGDPAFLEALK
jgi:hypothetical protein